MPSFKFVRQMLSKTLEVPEDSLGASFRLQIIGSICIICGSKKLIKYKSEEISVLTSDGVVSILGEHLKCLYFFEGTIEISGDICGVKIEKR